MTKRATKAQPLNELSGREWIKFTKSWFVLDPATNSKQIAAHPAAFPIELPTEFISFFTKTGQLVLDPFAGTGTTLAAAQRLGRQSDGIELEPSYVQFAHEHHGTSVAEGDATALLQDRDQYPDDQYDYVFTSPPYMNTLHQSRGGNKDTRHKIRRENGQPTSYGQHPADVGNIDDDATYISRLVQTFKSIHRVLKPRAYCTVVIQNLNHKGSLKPIAWQLAIAMQNTELWDLKGERIWCQDRRKLGIYGYPSAYATNNFHHYCLTFRKQ